MVTVTIAVFAALVAIVAPALALTRVQGVPVGEWVFGCALLVWLLVLVLALRGGKK